MIVALLRRPVRIGLTVAAGLAQVGEFSFILATLGLALGLIPDDAFQLVVAAALVSITLNPFVFGLVEPMERRIAIATGSRAVAPGCAGRGLTLRRGRRLPRSDSPYP